MTSFIFSQHTVVIALVLFLLMLLSIEVGYWVGRRRQGRFDETKRAHVNAVQASMLGIIALILGFSFSKSVERFNTRTEAVVYEANAIGTAYLRTKLAPPSVSEPAGKLVRDYVDLRVQTAGRSYEDLDPALIRMAEQMQADLWRYAQQAAADDPSPMTSLFVQSVNELIDAYGSRKASLKRHTPIFVSLLLFSAFLFTATVTGFASGIEGHRPSSATYFLVLLIVILVFVIEDLDRPRRGMIEVPQDSLIELQASVHADEKN